MKIKQIAFFIFLFSLKTAIPQGNGVFNDYGIYTFEFENDLTKSVWDFHICKDNCFALDTLTVFKNGKLKNKPEGFLLDDIHGMEQPEIFGKYNLHQDTLNFEFKGADEFVIKLIFIDSLNVTLVMCDINNHFVNTIGHKKLALYQNHMCGNLFSYDTCTRWYYSGVWNVKNNKKDYYWYFFDSLTNNSIFYTHKIPDTGSVVKYIVR